MTPTCQYSGESGSCIPDFRARCGECASSTVKDQFNFATNVIATFPFNAFDTGQPSLVPAAIF